MPKVTRQEGYYTESGQWVKPVVTVKCDCGRTVNCTHFTNTCVCERDYNMQGSLLASRDQWGEETGEHWMDCL